MENRSDVDLTFSLSRTIDVNGNDLGMNSRPWQGALPFEKLLVDNLTATGSAVVVRRDAVLDAGMFDATLVACQDLDLWLRLALRRRDCIFCVPEVLTSYRRRPGQLTRDWRTMLACQKTVLGRYCSRAGERAGRLSREADCNLYRFLAMVNYELGNNQQGLALMARSLLASPMTFLRTTRTYVVGGALLSRLVLPAALHQMLERTVRAW
jgi:hypothetical protein